MSTSSKTILFAQSDGKIIGRVATATLHTDIVLLLESRAAFKKPLEVVDVGVMVGITAVAVLLDIVSRINFCPAHIGHCHIIIGGVVGRLKEFGQFVGCLPAEHIAVCHMRLALCALLGLDEDHTIGSTIAVDRGRSGVLEERDALNVICIDIIDASCQTVDEDKRVIASRREGARTTNLYGSTCTWTT